MVGPSKGGPTRTGWLESRLQRHRHVPLGVVLLLAVLARLVVFVQLNEGPLLHLQDWEQSDMHFFHAWSRAIAAGDRLSAEVGHPQHLWHRAVADAYFARHPEARGALARELGTDDPARHDAAGGVPDWARTQEARCAPHAPRCNGEGEGGQ